MMIKPLAAVWLALVTACAGGDVKGTYLPREGDDGRYIQLGDSGQAVVHAQGKVIRTPYVIDGTRLQFTAFGTKAAGELRGGCVEFAAATYCRRHYIHVDGATRSP